MTEETSTLTQKGREYSSLLRNMQEIRVSGLHLMLHRLLVAVNVGYVLIVVDAKIRRRTSPRLLSLASVR